MKQSTTTLLTMGVVLVAVVWFLTGGFKPTVGAVGGGAQVQTQAGAVLCPDTLSTTLNVRYQNIVNTTDDDWQNPAVEIWTSTGSRVGSQTPAALTGAYATQAVNCGASGVYYAIGSSAINSANGQWMAEGANAYTDLLGSRASALNYRILNSLQNNITGGDTDSFTTGNTSAEDSIVAGDTKIYYIHLKPANAASQYGDHIGGFLLCTRASLGTYDVITITGGKNPQVVPVPASVSGTNTKCWKDVGVRSDEGYREYKLTVHANTEPTATHTLQWDVYDFQSYVGTSGKIKNDIRDDANAGLGAADNTASIRVS